MLKAKPLEQLRSEKLIPALEEVTKEPLVRLNVNVPKSMYRELKARAATEDACISDLVKLWVKEYLSRPAGVSRSRLSSEE